MIKRYVTTILLSLGLFLVTMGIAIAEDASSQKQSIPHFKSVQAVYQELQIIKQKNKVLAASNHALAKQLQQMKHELGVEPVSQGQLKKAELALATAKAEVDAINLSIAEAQHNKDVNQIKIQRLETQLRTLTLRAGAAKAVTQRIQQLQNDLSAQQTIMQWLHRQLETYNKTYQLVNEQYQLQLGWKRALDAQLERQKQALRQEKVAQQELALQQQQRQILAQLASYNLTLQSLAKTEPTLAREELRLKILQAQERSNLIQLQLDLLHVHSSVINLLDMEHLGRSVYSLNNLLAEAESDRNELHTINQLIKRKIDLLKQRQQIVEKKFQQGLMDKSLYEHYKQTIPDILQQYEKQQTNTEKLVKQNTQLTEQLQQALSNALARRQGLPGFSLDAWGHLGYKLTTMPSLTLKMLNALKEQVVIDFRKSSIFKILTIVFAQVFLLWLWITLRNIVGRIVASFSEERRSITENMRFVLMKLIEKNLLFFYLLGAVFLLFWTLSIPIKSFIPLMVLALVVLIFKMAIDLARLVLIETSTDAEGKDVKLYHHLKWALLGGGVLTLLTVLAQQLPVGFEVRDFFNRLFSLFMLVVAVLLLRSWKVIPFLLQPYVEGARPYVMKMIKLISFLIPVTILITALIGFFGYVDLAWTILKYEGRLLLVIAGFVLVRGFIKDFMEWLSEVLIRRMRNGWLWTQAILRPLDKILQVGLFILTVAFVFYLYGWDKDSYMYQQFFDFFHIHLLSLKGTVITPLGIIEFIITGFVLVWLSRWTREFSYRWLFARTTDIGLRNSLAAFTQYTTVIIGLIIALRIIGIDLSGIEYVLGGFAIAAGFGMRDLIKNYASGILLLIERPVRTGDLVSIGSFEGTVTRIGMRSMTVKTWDHMEVLVPNSETFEKPFTNWTHQDCIVRTVINLKFNRADNPHKIRDIILEVVDENPEIVSNPRPRVFMRELNESLLDIDVKYFINLQSGSSRVAVRSDVLFNLWEAFSKAGIRPPYPQQDIHLKTLPSKQPGDQDLVL